jgi:integrase
MRCELLKMQISTRSPKPPKKDSAEKLAPRNSRRRKVWLTELQVNRMLELAEKSSERDYLLLQLMRYGLRCGEIVGWRGLPGIRVTDLREKGIWIKGKGFARGIVQDRLVPIPSLIMDRLRIFTSTSAARSAKIFPISEVRAEQIVKKYAKLAGVEDWKLVGPHRLRAFFATNAKDRGFDAFTIRDLMRHKNITTTNLYVGQSSSERLSNIIESISNT